MDWAVGSLKNNRVCSIMADVIKELYSLPKEEQEFILENLSHQYIPIEIDGDIYMIPDEVNSLIDSLISQVNELRLKAGEKVQIGKEGY